MSQFKMGDVVQLPSGGPEMTISAFYFHTSGVNSGNRTGKVECSWFERGEDGVWELKRADFWEQALVTRDTFHETLGRIRETVFNLKVKKAE